MKRICIADLLCATSLYVLSSCCTASAFNKPTDQTTTASDLTLAPQAVQKQYTKLIDAIGMKDMGEAGESLASSYIYTSADGQKLNLSQWKSMTAALVRQSKDVSVRFRVTSSAQTNVTLVIGVTRSFHIGNVVIEQQVKDIWKHPGGSWLLSETKVISETRHDTVQRAPPAPSGPASNQALAPPALTQSEFAKQPDSDNSTATLDETLAWLKNKATDWCGYSYHDRTSTITGAKNVGLENSYSFAAEGEGRIKVVNTIKSFQDLAVSDHLEGHSNFTLEVSLEDLNPSSVTVKEADNNHYTPPVVYWQISFACNLDSDTQKPETLVKETYHYELLENNAPKGQPIDEVTRKGFITIEFSSRGTAERFANALKHAIILSKVTPVNVKPPTPNNLPHMPGAGNVGGDDGADAGTPDYQNAVKEGNLALSGGLKTRAARKYAEAAHLLPSKTETALKAARLYYDLQQFVDAAELAALARDNAVSDTLRKEAGDLLASWLLNFYDPITVEYRAALRLLKDGRPSDAAVQLATYTPVIPNQKMALANLAIALYAAGDKAKATNALKQWFQLPGVRGEDFAKAPAACYYAPDLTAAAIKDEAITRLMTDAFGDSIVSRVQKLVIDGRLNDEPILLIDDADYWPAQAGNTWEESWSCIITDPASKPDRTNGTSTCFITRAETKQGKKEVDERATTKVAGSPDSVAEWRYLLDARGVMVTYPDGRQERMLAYPLVAGQKWQSKSRGTSTVVRTETVETPAGTFNAVLVHSVDPTGGLSGTGLTLDEWYAPGVGCVKSVLIYAGSSRTDQELVRYSAK